MASMSGEISGISGVLRESGCQSPGMLPSITCPTRTATIAGRSQGPHFAPIFISLRTPGSDFFEPGVFNEM
jgi:hypothetical protein